MKKFAILFLTSILVIQISFSQENNNDIFTPKKLSYNTWAIGVKTGPAIFYGDIMDYDFFPSKFGDYGIGGGMFVNKQISPFFGLQAEFNRGELHSSKNELYFDAIYSQYGINAYFSLTDILFRKVEQKKVNFYFLVGIGLIDFRTGLKKSIENLPDEIVDFEGYNVENDFLTKNNKNPTSEFIVPAALGLNVKLNYLVDFNIETSLYNLVASDKLDADKVSNTRNDKYGYTTIGFNFKIGKEENYHLAWISSLEKQEFEEKLAKKNKSKIDSLNDELADMQRRLFLMDSLAKLKPEPEADDDADGVPNSRDLEPDTPEGNMVNFQGVSLPKADTVNSIEQDLIIQKNKELLFSVYFDFDSFEVKEEHKIKIVEAVKKLNAEPEITVEILGHADQKGSPEYNKELSKKRTESVAKLLIDDFGIDPKRIIQSSAGEDHPLSKGDDFINRRVDFIIIKN